MNLHAEKIRLRSRAYHYGYRLHIKKDDAGQRPLHYWLDRRDVLVADSSDTGVLQLWLSQQLVDNVAGLKPSTKSAMAAVLHP